MRWAMWIRVGIAFSLAAAVLLAGCDRGEPVERSLVDGIHEPEVLSETPRLEWPPSLVPNRFVRGWHPWNRGGERTLVPGAGESVFEVVNLKQRKRQLTVKFSVFELEPGLEARVCVDGVELTSVPLANPLVIDLPALPRGRVAVTLNCGGNPRPPSEGEAPLGVSAAFIRPSLPAGDVSFEPGGVVQAPWSAVDFVRRVESPSRLLGRFRAPATADGGRFTLTAEWQGGDRETLYEWPGDGEEIDVVLGRQTGLVRLRLAAEGDGPPGRWEELRLLSRERVEPPAPPPPAAPRLVVLYILDALRADALGHLGGVSGVSPTIDRLASEGVTLTNHFTVAPNTMPSTKALFTGRAFRTKGGWKLPPEGDATLAEAWAAAGYRTGAFSANAFVSDEFGLARGFELAPRQVGAVGVNTGMVASARRVHRYGLEWLDRLDRSESVLLYLHTVHPHNPYDPPEPFRSRFTGGIESDIDGSSRTLLDIKHQRIEASPADRERLKGLYRGGLAYNDAELAKLLEILEARYAPGEMLFVITSDHGEELFEHGGVLHGYTLYDEQLHVPLIFWWPGVLEPRVVDRPTDALDLHATLRALVDPEGPAVSEGQSLWPLLTGDRQIWSKPVRFAAASSLKQGVFMARSDTAKLIWAPRWGMGQGLGRTRDAEYLFDLRADPRELRNLAGGADLEAAWLRSQLLGWIEREKVIDLEGASPDEIDEETRRRLRALGYLE